LTYPSTSDWKRTPSSNALVSVVAGVVGASTALNSEHGQATGAAVVNDHE
jgi:hypothetical protein